LIKSRPEASIPVTPLSSNHEMTGIISSGSGAIRSRICSVVHHFPVYQKYQIDLFYRSSLQILLKEINHSWENLDLQYPAKYAERES
jgi:hypothetical protein